MTEKFEDVSKEEILQRVAALEFDRFLQYYENAADLNMRDDRRPDRQAPQRDRGESSRGQGQGRTITRSSSRDEGRGSSSSGEGFKKLFVNLGTKDGFYKASFLQFILDMSDLSKEVLGKIDMKDMNTWVEIEGGAANQMIKSLDGKKFKGRRIRMNDAETGGSRNNY